MQKLSGLLQGATAAIETAAALEQRPPPGVEETQLFLYQGAIIEICAALTATRGKQRDNLIRLMAEHYKKVVSTLPGHLSELKKALGKERALSDTFRASNEMLRKQFAMLELRVAAAEAEEERLRRAARASQQAKASSARQLTTAQEAFAKLVAEHKIVKEALQQLEQGQQFARDRLQLEADTLQERLVSFADKTEP